MEFLTYLGSRGSLPKQQNLNTHPKTHARTPDPYKTVKGRAPEQVARPLRAAVQRIRFACQVNHCKFMYVPLKHLGGIEEKLLHRNVNTSTFTGPLKLDFR